MFIPREIRNKPRANNADSFCVRGGWTAVGRSVKTGGLRACFGRWLKSKQGE